MVMVTATYQARNKDELSLDKGTIISVVSMNNTGTWAAVQDPKSNKTGWIPANYIQVLNNSPPSHESAGIQVSSSNHIRLSSSSRVNSTSEVERVSRTPPDNKMKFLREVLPTLSRTQSSSNFLNSKRSTTRSQSLLATVPRPTRNNSTNTITVPGLSLAGSAENHSPGAEEGEEIYGGNAHRSYDDEKSVHSVKFNETGSENATGKSKERKSSPRLKKEHSSPFVTAIVDKRRIVREPISGDIAQTIPSQKNLLDKIINQEDKVKDQTPNSTPEGERKKKSVKSRLEKILENNINKNNTSVLTSSSEGDHSGSIEELILKKLFKNQTVLIKDRKFQTKTYRNCFVGKEFVDWLIISAIATSRAEGIALGNKLLSNGFIESVFEDNTQFKDEFLYYRFSKQRIPKKRRDSNKSKISKIVKRDSSLSPRKPNTLLSNKDTKRQLQYVLHEIEEFYLLKPIHRYINTHKIIPFIVNPKFETYIETQMKEETLNSPFGTQNSTEFDPYLESAMDSSQSIPIIDHTNSSLSESLGGNKPLQLSVRKSLKKLTPTSSKTQIKVTNQCSINNNNRHQKRILEKKLKEQKEKEKKVKHKESSKLLLILNGILEKGKKFKDPPPAPDEDLLPLPPELPGEFF